MECWYASLQNSITPERSNLQVVMTRGKKTSSVKGSIRSKRCALDPAFRTEATQHIFHGFGA